MNNCWKPPLLAQHQGRAEHVLLDLWGTIMLGPDAEPTKIVYDGLNLHQHGIRLDDFMPVALTVPCDAPHAFLREIAEVFSTDVPDHLHGGLSRIVELELSELTMGRILPKPVITTIPGNRPANYSPGRAGLFEDVIPCLRKLQSAGAINSLCTNTWRLCDVRRVMRSYGLDNYLENILVSGEMGIAKQSGIEFFLECVRLLNTTPSACVVVDDNLYLGVVPAVLAGMRGVLIDRYRQYTNEQGESLTHVDGSPMYPDIRRLNIRVIHDMDQLPAVLDYSNRAA
jgi:FMN phosphatase YigB (HAD superfamily)